MTNSGNKGEKPEKKTSTPKGCPKCGAALIYGYGLMVGGVGPYVVCDGDECDFFEKTQDADE